MKATKFIVLAAGIVGLIAFFLPLVAVKDSGVKGAISAFQIVKGIDSAQDVVEGGTATNPAADRAAAKDANEALGKVKGIVLALFVPAALLTLFGGIGAKKQRFGRGLGVGSLLVGLLGLAIWALLSTAAKEAGGDGGSVAGIGLHLLMLTGLGGLIGGLAALVKPDRGGPQTA
jgi:hypothetical protein